VQSRTLLGTVAGLLQLVQDRGKYGVLRERGDDVYIALPKNKSCPHDFLGPVIVTYN
jgi:hypothetical protein